MQASSESPGSPRQRIDEAFGIEDSFASIPSAHSRILRVNAVSEMVHSCPRATIVQVAFFNIARPDALEFTMLNDKIMDMRCDSNIL